MAKKYFLDVGQYTLETPQLKKGDPHQTSIFELDGKGENHQVVFEARSSKPLVLNALLATGETVYLDGGNIVRFDGRIRGAAALSLDAQDVYSYTCNKAAVIRGEALDPTPVAVSMKLAPSDDLRSLIRDEVARRLRAIDPEKFGADEDLVEELIEEAISYDHDFEDDDPELDSDYEEDDEFYFEDDPDKSPEGDPERPPEAEKSEPDKGDPTPMHSPT